MSSSVSDTGSSGGVGDWICGDVTCRHLNFARRNQCNKCRRSRSTEPPERGSSGGGNGSSSKARKLGTEIGKVAAEKSRGLFSAEDWQCSKCANVNWARRSTCNMCSQAKVCDVEERTGFGGGYNDRGVVEYKDHVESDSEYDEFGRLKKRKTYSNHSNEKKQKLGDQEEEEMGDDDEDDDDDDLAKYDLFVGDDGNDGEPNDNVANTKSKEFNDSSVSNSNKIDSSRKRRSRSKTRSDNRRHHSSPFSSSSSPAVSRSKSRSAQRSHVRKRSHSRSPRSSPRKPSVQRHRHRSSSRDKISRDKTKVSSNHASHNRRGYSSKSRSKSHSSTRSPSSKRNRSRNSSSSRKHSRSPRSHRRHTSRSRSISPKRKR